MDLFTTIENINTTVPDIITQLTEGNKFYAGYRKLTNYLHVQGWFLHAIEQRDRDALEFLMAKEQDCTHWKTKQEFIDKFIGTCSKLEAKQPIFLKVWSGSSFEKGLYAGRSAISVEVKAVEKDIPLWKFNLAYHLDEKKKIHVKKAYHFIGHIQKPIVKAIIGEPRTEKEEPNYIGDCERSWTDADIEAIFELCPDCKMLGYCKKEVVLKDSIIVNMIPLIFEGVYYGNPGEYVIKHLVAAFEAFHQKDYEAAILNSQIVLKENKSIAMPFLVIAVSQYFLGDLSEALRQYGQYLNTLEYIREEEGVLLMRFIWHCENKLSALQGR